MRNVELDIAYNAGIDEINGAGDAYRVVWGLHDGGVPTVFWFDRFDERIGILPVAGELVHTEELNGEDTLEF